VRRQARRLARRMLTAVGPSLTSYVYVPTRASRAMPSPLDRFIVSLLPGPTSVADARRLTVNTLDRWGLTERASDAAVVVSELAGNAFRHGRGPVRLVLRCEPTAYGPAAACTVRDTGKWTGGRIPDRAAIEAAISEEGGRGLYIARELADSLTVRAARYRPGTVVTATFTSRGA
jgi:anti-sigma regulatory factor (Ser/Thr protein kinase)